MVNKLWYQGDDIAEDELKEIIASRAYIQEYITLYCPERFSVPEDITPDNLQEFLEIILKYYQLYLFDDWQLKDLAESIRDVYFYKAYREDFPDTDFPRYLKTDRRELALYILDQMDYPYIMPEDVPTLIKCLNVPEEQIIDMYDYIDNYFDQFDHVERSRDLCFRFNLVNEQRKAAIEKRQPLPIRLMGIKIDPYYEKCLHETSYMKK